MIFESEYMFEMEMNLFDINFVDLFSKSIILRNFETEYM